jgi:hypothetical protein
MPEMNRVAKMLDRQIEIPLPKFVESAARRVFRSRILHAFAWNVPILLAMLGFLLGFQAVKDRPVFDGMGFHWGVTNAKTMRAEGLMLWTAAHLLVPLICAVLYNSVYLLRPSSQLLRYLRWALLIGWAAFCFWYFEQGFYLVRKIVII